jgi:hypothetical protein
LSFRMTIGRFVTGSTINPLMVISISMTRPVPAAVRVRPTDDEALRR